MKIVGMVQDWTKIKEKKQGNAIVKTFKLPNGSIVNFPIQDHGKGSGILAITEDKKVILVKQFRPGPEKYVYDLPGGFIEKDEDPIAAAERELLEETGFAGKLEFICNNIVSCYSNERLFSFIATNCKKISDPNPEKNEFIAVELVEFERFKTMLLSGEMPNGETSYQGLLQLGYLQWANQSGC